MFLIMGLGNPGPEYSKTRHNAGFMTLDILSERLGIPITRRGFRSVYGEGRQGGERLVLAKPMTYMNDSGMAAVDLVNWYKPSHDCFLVIFDDADLPTGALRIRENGSAGTHNGMRSIIRLLGFDDFPRVRIGIGSARYGMIDHVLGVPNREDAELLQKAFAEAAEAIELIIRGELHKAQEKFNYKPPKKPKPRGGAQAIGSPEAEAESSGSAAGVIPAVSGEAPRGNRAHTEPAGAEDES